MKKSRQSRKMKNIVFAVLLAIAVGLASVGCKKSEVAPHKTDAASVAAKEEGTVTVSPDVQKSYRIETVIAAPESLSAPISATAVIEFNADKVSKISPRTSGRIVEVNVSQGDRVKSSQVIALFDTPEVGEIWSNYVKAKKRVEIAKKNLLREETLFEKKVSPEKDVLIARQELHEAEADLVLSIERFRLLGVDIAEFEAGGKAGHPLIPLSSPISGVVVEKNVSQGEVVGLEKTLFTVADLSTLWVLIDIYEKDIAKVRVGTPVSLSVASFADRSFPGTISYVGDTVDVATRTVKARVVIDNRTILLKPGMFANVTLEGVTGGDGKVIAVPDNAVLMDGAQRYVFVKAGEGKFKRRDVSVGRSFGKKTVITEGLKEGEAVVTEGAFLLKSEMKK